MESLSPTPCGATCCPCRAANAPFIAFDDADIDAAMEGAMIAKMRTEGEAHTAANRLCLHRTIHDRFAERLAARTSILAAGARWAARRRLRGSK